MEARIFRVALLAALLLVASGARVRTPNFLVQTADPQMAQQIAQAAEQYRRDLAIEWLGKPMPDWAQPCVMTVHLAPNLGAGGATTFVFDRGEVFGWRMTIQGSPQRVLDSVLPHEITHMILASHFRRPLPRWADEGAASTVEHPSEQAKHRRMLSEFLRTNRGLPFSYMFAMTEYPADVMPLYAQGFSLAEFLIQRGGRKRYVEYLAEGMQTNRWSEATRRHYGFQDLGGLQQSWLAWVAQGCPAASPPEPDKARVLAADGRLPRPAPNLIYRTGRQRESPARTVAGALGADVDKESLPIPSTLPAAETEPISAYAAHPQPIERPQAMVLQPGQ